MPASDRCRSLACSVMIGLAVLAGLASLAGCSPDELTSRQAGVAARGSQVMPFDLERTTHTFTKNPTGGTQHVSADDPADRNQIDLIRRHLREEADKFSRGDFQDPARIHGIDMPGVAELEAGHSNVTVTYSDTPDGARLDYDTADANLVAAIHAWFDRQVTDHGSHAHAG